MGEVGVEVCWGCSDFGFVESSSKEIKVDGSKVKKPPRKA